MLRKELSAGYGIISWLEQRITAIIMLVALIFILAFFIIANQTIELSFISWQAFFNLVFVRIVVQILVLAIALHAWVGIRDLWMDYIQSAVIKLTLYVLTILWLLGSLIYSAMILWT